LRNKRFSIKVDEATDCSGNGHMTAYVRYVEGAAIKEDTFFCKLMKRRTSEKEGVKIVYEFVEEKSIKLSGCVGICTYVSRVMAGNIGLQALIKPSAPEAMWTHCVIYRE
jgi:hypothetical protein